MDKLDIFNRDNLLGDQSITTINNFNNYVEGLLNPFNNILTDLLIELDSIKIDKPFIYTTLLINQLQINNNNILNSKLLIDNASVITTDCSNYITELEANKITLSNIFNDKALPTSSLTRPTLRTIVSSNKSAVNKQYVTNEVLKYSLPTPIPNTRLFVNKDGKSLIWA